MTSYSRGENTVIPVLTTALLTRHTGEDGDGPQHQQHSVLRLNRVKPHRTTNGHFFFFFSLFFFFGRTTFECVH